MQPTVRELLGLQATNSVRMCIPQFAGVVSNEDGIVYRGSVRANRDVTAALHISELAIEAGAEVSYFGPDEPCQDQGTLVFLGSRSNAATNAFMRGPGRNDVVWFEYGYEWAIHSRSGRRYALRDPSTLNRETYAASTDYGVVALYNELGSTSVVVAGLGGRATEGCGLFLRENWQDLAVRAKGARVFAAILKFAPPVDPSRYEIAEFVTN